MRANVARVLLVEDDHFVEPVLRRVLDTIDPSIELVWAKTVAEAREALVSKPFSLVIADHWLGRGSTGLDLWKYCLHSFPETRFLVISGTPLAMLKEDEGLQEVRIPFLQKPFKPRECGKLIESAMASTYR